jgi:Conjugal transfer protein TraD
MDKAEFEAKRSAIRAQKHLLQIKEYKRFGLLMQSAGLMGLSFDPEQLRSGLQEIAHHFKNAPPSKFAREMKRLEQRENRLSLRYMGERSRSRRRDTRDKFLLGSLVVKAGLRNADQAFLLGALMTLGKIDPTSDQYRRITEAGLTAFESEQV